MKSIFHPVSLSNERLDLEAIAADCFGSSERRAGVDAVDSWYARKGDNAGCHSTVKERKALVAIGNSWKLSHFALGNEKQLDSVEIFDGWGKGCTPLCGGQHIRLSVPLIPND